MEPVQIVQEIQYTLAPAIMISSSALLLLGFQNKFSSLFNRFRTLNQERRNLNQKINRDALENSRLENLKEQLPRIMKRATHVKNAVLLTYGAILCFIATSVFLFLNLYTDLELTHWTIGIFMMGLLLVLVSAVFMIVETTIAFRILVLEGKS